MAANCSSTLQAVKLCKCLPRTLHCDIIPRTLPRPIFSQVHKRIGANYRKIHWGLKKRIKSAHSYGHAQAIACWIQACRVVRSITTHLPFYSHFSTAISSWPLTETKPRARWIFDLIQRDQCDPCAFILHLLSLASKIRAVDKEFLFYVSNFWRTEIFDMVLV